MIKNIYIWVKHIKKNYTNILIYIFLKYSHNYFHRNYRLNINQLNFMSLYNFKGIFTEYVGGGARAAHLKRCAKRKIIFLNKS